MSAGIVSNMDEAAERARRELLGQEGGGEEMSQEEREIRAEMTVEGVVYSVQTAKAAQFKWALTPPLPGVGNDLRVLVDPSFGNTHRYVKLTPLGDEFNDIPIEGYTKEVLGLVLSNVYDSAVQFAVDWVESGWYESEAHVGPLAEKATVIEAVAGFISATRSNTNSRRQAFWRLASFINEALLIVGKN